MTTPNVGKDAKRLAQAYIRGGNMKCYNHSRKQLRSFLKEVNVGAPGWLSRLSNQLLVLAQVMNSWFVCLSPHVGLCADSTEPAWNSLFPSLSAPPLLALSLCLCLALSQNK